ncbi:MAG: EamA family transporter [Moraxellaceae bacterium]|nr:EamA family transporter [Moraxellaceae bacterium]
MNTLSLILVSCLLTAIGQIAFKWGMQGFADVQVSGGGLPRLLWNIFTTPSIVIGFAAFGLGAVLWLFALAKAELSYAVPLASITYVLVLIAGVVLFKEPLTFTKIAGTSLVAAGVVLVSMK